MATMRTTVGRSPRTPAKHDLMYALFSREIGSAQVNPMFDDIAWYDLTAGDGVPIDRDWHRSCSPGILAHHARWVAPRRTPKPVTVHLYERAANTYADLVANLAANLPGLGYTQTDDATWRQGTATMTAHHAPANTATFDHVGPRTAVMLANDPNNVDQWACPEVLLDNLCRRSRYTLMLSTMGCNAAGLKREGRIERDRWFDHVRAQINARAAWHDCHLSAIQRDAHQWAYLITAPSVWQQGIEQDARKAFGRYGFTLDEAWFGRQRDTFQEIIERLFLTRSEREAS